MRCSIILLSMATGCHLVAGLDDPSPVETSAASSSTNSTSTGGTSGTGGSGGADCSGSVEYREIVLADMPVGYWRLGDQGAVAKDEIRTHGGAYQGQYTLNRPGALVCDRDTAVRFPGANTLILMDANVHDEAPLSLEAWMAPTGVDLEKRYVISKAFSDTGGATGYALYVHNFSILTFVAALNGADVHASTTRFDIDTWNHVVATLEGSTACLYVNGELVEPCTRGSVTLTSTNEPFKIGAYTDEGADGFIGTIDEVAIYDVALSAAQIREHYAAGLQIEP
jgi:hypothetical protein